MIRQLSASVVICTRNRASSLAKCLACVAQLDYPEFEVLVVDNGSSDSTAEVVRQHGARYLYVARPGVSHARNAGVQHARGEILAFLDDDAEPDRQWLNELCRVFDDPEIMAAGGHDQPFDVAQVPAHRKAVIVGQQTAEWFPIAAFGGIGDGCNMAFRRSSFNYLPGFDERLGRGAAIRGGEEHFNFVRLVAMGYKCAHVPAAVVWHGSSEQRLDVGGESASAIAYVLLLLKEMPQQRSLLLVHLLRSLMGARRSWREHRAQVWQKAQKFSAVRRLLSLPSGIRLFAGACSNEQRRAPLLMASSKPR